ncbi:MAG: hypothetical protein ACFFFO_17710 [Candidatus Thorarchaeota archaeon]
MSPKRHKTKLLRIMTHLRDAVSETLEHRHIKYPYPELHELEIQLHKMVQAIERQELE